MDSEFWTTRLAAAKRQYTLQHHQQSSLFDDSVEVKEDEELMRPDFPCPYCYDDFDFVSLCSHLEDEHSCESAVTVCPICAVKVSRDMLSHFTLQHGNLFKMQRRCRLRRVSVPNSQALSLLGRNLREAHLQVLLGSGGYRSENANVSNVDTDQGAVLNCPASGADDISKSAVKSAEEDTRAKNVAPSHMWKSSFDPSLSREEREKRIRQANGRAGFVQDLFLSTMLSD